jgi:hypothetical protein
MDAHLSRLVKLKRNSEGTDAPAWRLALLFTVLLRLTYTLFAAVISLVQPVNGRLVHSNALTENLRPPDHSLQYLLFGVWERFDTLWYLHIAAQGYDRPDSVVFFPLYPELIRIVSRFMPAIAAALLISTVAAFFLVLGLQELLLADQPLNLVHRSVCLCCLWPASFIFFAGYPESLLFALIVWSLSMARRERWLGAVALGLAASMTKAVGVVIIVPLLVAAIRQNQKMRALSVLLIPVGLAGCIRYLHGTVPGTLASAYAQYWRTLTVPPWATLWESVRTLAHMPNPILALNMIFLVSAIVLVTRSRLRIEYLLYSAAAIVIFLCKETTPPLQSMMRYLLIIFPAFVGFARILQSPHAEPRFAMVCAALFMFNLGLLWLFLGWSLVL